jgi:hypothetical protein
MKVLSQATGMKRAIGPGKTGQAALRRQRKAGSGDQSQAERPMRRHRDCLSSENEDAGSRT